VPADAPLHAGDSHRRCRVGGKEDTLSANAGAAFLDRDGTIIEEVGYLDRPDRLDLYPWSIAAIRALNLAGLRVVLVTNQSGIARGFFTPEMLERIHAHMDDLLAAGGARIDAYYYCPHHPDGKVPEFAMKCECRKPGPGLVERAVRELGIDPRESVVIGDRWLDVALARAVGARGVLVRTGYGVTEEGRPPQGLSADAVVDNLAGAASWVLQNLGRPGA
jgi:D-glycero-D-manno-heptose 1,7-bisphosphate phosphatase